MKVILLHDWLTGMRGGERVLEAFCELFPEAPLYTLIYKRGSTTPLIENRPIHASFLNRVPSISEHYRKFLPLFPKAADSLRLEKADLILSSSHCVIKAVRKPQGAKHISYIHSPMRYIYDQFENYFGEQAPLIQRLGATALRGYLTRYDLASNANVDVMVANSRFVQSRIRQYYGRESLVVHPFVGLEDFEGVKAQPPPKKDFFLMVTAFAPNKRVDLAIEAFNKTGIPLKIVGSGQQEKQLKKMSRSNIEFLGSLQRPQIVSMLAQARALIFPGVEDFGITPLEALAAGTPVIAFRAGGVLETLDDKVALFFEKPNAESLASAIKRLDSVEFDRMDLQRRAARFSKEKFKKEILKVITQTQAIPSLDRHQPTTIQ